MLANIRKFSIKLAIDHDIGFLEESLSGASSLRRLIGRLGQVLHATLNAILHVQVRIDDPNVVSTIWIVISPVERVRKRQMVFREHAPRYS